MSKQSGPLDRTLDWDPGDWGGLFSALLLNYCLTLGISFNPSVPFSLYMFIDIESSLGSNGFTLHSCASRHSWTLVLVGSSMHCHNTDIAVIICE